MKNILGLLSCLGVVLVLSACTSVIPKNMLAQADQKLTIADVQDHPDSYSGSGIVWAGIITDIKNLKDSTIIEVLRKPADHQGRPKEGDTSDGRFLATYNGFLDPAIYTVGREVTIAGKVKGTKSSVIGEYDYTYPVIEVTDIHLWPVQPNAEYNYYYYPSPPYYYRWWYW